MIPCVCAWAGCRSNFAGNLPEGWVWLLTYYRAEPNTVFDYVRERYIRDAALCPEHAAALEQQLKRI